MRSILLILVLGTVLVACGGLGERLTVTEYAERFCGRDLYAGDNLTNRDVIERAEGFVDELESVSSPTEVEGYHDYALNTFQLIIKVLEQEDPNDVFNVFSLLGLGSAIAGDADRAKESIPDDALAVLNEHGCGIETDDEQQE